MLTDFYNKLESTLRELDPTHHYIVSSDRFHPTTVTFFIDTLPGGCCATHPVDRRDLVQAGIDDPQFLVLFCCEMKRTLRKKLADVIRKARNHEKKIGDTHVK